MTSATVMSALKTKLFQDDDMFTPDVSDADDSPLPGLIVADDTESDEDSGKSASLRHLVENVIHCLEEDSEDVSLDNKLGSPGVSKPDFEDQKSDDILDEAENVLTNSTEDTIAEIEPTNSNLSKEDSNGDKYVYNQNYNNNVDRPSTSCSLDQHMTKPVSKNVTGNFPREFIHDEDTGSTNESQDRSRDTNSPTNYDSDINIDSFLNDYCGVSLSGDKKRTTECEVNSDDGHQIVSSSPKQATIKRITEDYLKEDNYSDDSNISDAVHSDDSSSKSLSEMVSEPDMTEEKLHDVIDIADSDAERTRDYSKEEICAEDSDHGDLDDQESDVTKPSRDNESELDSEGEKSDDVMDTGDFDAERKDEMVIEVDSDSPVDSFGNEGNEHDTREEEKMSIDERDSDESQSEIETTDDRDVGDSGSHLKTVDEKDAGDSRSEEETVDEKDLEESQSEEETVNEKDLEESRSEEETVDEKDLEESRSEKETVDEKDLDNNRSGEETFDEKDFEDSRSEKETVDEKDIEDSQSEEETFDEKDNEDSRSEEETVDEKDVEDSRSEEETVDEKHVDDSRSEKDTVDKNDVEVIGSEEETVDEKDNEDSRSEEDTVDKNDVKDIGSEAETVDEKDNEDSRSEEKSVDEKNVEDNPDSRSEEETVDDVDEPNADSCGPCDSDDDSDADDIHGKAESEHDVIDDADRDEASADLCFFTDFHSDKAERKPTSDNNGDDENENDDGDDENEDDGDDDGSCKRDIAKEKLDHDTIDKGTSMDHDTANSENDDSVTECDAEIDDGSKEQPLLISDDDNDDGTDDEVSDDDDNDAPRERKLRKVRERKPVKNDDNDDDDDNDAPRERKLRKVRERKPVKNPPSTSSDEDSDDRSDSADESYKPPRVNSESEESDGSGRNSILKRLRKRPYRPGNSIASDRKRKQMKTSTEAVINKTRPEEKKVSKLFIGVKGTLGLQIGNAATKTFYNLLISEENERHSMYMVPVLNIETNKIYSVLPSDDQEWEITESQKTEKSTDFITQRYQSKGRMTLRLIESDTVLEPEQVEFLQNLIPSESRNQKDMGLSNDIRYYRVISPKHAVNLLVKGGLRDFDKLKRLRGCVTRMIVPISVDTRTDTSETESVIGDSNYQSDCSVADKDAEVSNTNAKGQTKADSHIKSVFQSPDYKSHSTMPAASNKCSNRSSKMDDSVGIPKKGNSKDSLHAAVDESSGAIKRPILDSRSGLFKNGESSENSDQDDSAKHDTLSNENEISGSGISSIPESQSGEKRETFFSKSDNGKNADAVETDVTAIRPVLLFSHEEASRLSLEKDGVLHSMQSAISEIPDDSKNNTMIPDLSIESETEKYANDLSTQEPEDGGLQLKIGSVFSLATGSFDFDALPGCDQEIKPPTITEHVAKSEVDGSDVKSISITIPVSPGKRNKTNVNLALAEKLRLKVQASQTDDKNAIKKMAIKKTDGVSSIQSQFPILQSAIKTDSLIRPPTIKTDSPIRQPAIKTDFGSRVPSSSPHTLSGIKKTPHPSPTVINIGLSKPVYTQSLVQPSIIEKATHINAAKPVVRNTKRPTILLSQSMPQNMILLPQPNINIQKKPGEAGAATLPNQLAPNSIVTSRGSVPTKYCLVNLNGQKLVVPLVIQKSILKNPPAAPIVQENSEIVTILSKPKLNAAPGKTDMVKNEIYAFKGGKTIRVETTNKGDLSAAKSVDTPSKIIQIKSEPVGRGYSDEIEGTCPPVKKIKIEAENDDNSAGLTASSVITSQGVEKQSQGKDSVPSKLSKKDNNSESSKNDRISLLKRLLKEKEMALEGLRHKRSSDTCPADDIDDPT